MQLRHTGVSRKILSSIINGKAGISPEMTVRLSIAFNTSSESWMNQQSQYDLWQVEQHRDELRFLNYWWSDVCLARLIALCVFIIELFCLFSI
ncbi:MAG: HigA family addiction module antitoxin [Methylococcaceae bacterium]|nr:HigA family addiction module antitoxin [Methylococcaceae bacterium]